VSSKELADPPALGAGRGRRRETDGGVRVDEAKDAEHARDVVRCSLRQGRGQWVALPWCRAESPLCALDGPHNAPVGGKSTGGRPPGWDM